MTNSSSADPSASVVALHVINAPNTASKAHEVETSVTPVAVATSPSSSSTKFSSFKSQHFIAGAIGGMTAAVITSPLEVVKTRLQVRPSPANLLNPSCSLTTFGVMQQIFKNESIAGLWRGITPTLMGVIPARAIYFGAYNKFKETFAHRDMNGRMYNFLAAAGAGSFSATLVCPIWVVKTRVQLLPAHSTGELMKHVTFSSASSSYASTRPNILTLGLTTARPLSTIATKPSTIPLSSVRRVAWEMYCKEGPRAFFRGLSASYWGISESAIQFALYEESKEWIEEPNAMKYFIAAGASKLLAAAMTYPHEVVRTRMRDQRGPIGSKDLKYRTMFQSIRTIFREEGTRGLYGGMPAHLMRVVPNAAIMFLVVELLTKKDSDDS